MERCYVVPQMALVQHNHCITVKLLQVVTVLVLVLSLACLVDLLPLQLPVLLQLFLRGPKLYSVAMLYIHPSNHIAFASL